MDAIETYQTVGYLEQFTRLVEQLRSVFARMDVESEGKPSPEAVKTTKRILWDLDCIAADIVGMHVEGPADNGVVRLQSSFEICAAHLGVITSQGRRQIDDPTNVLIYANTQRVAGEAFHAQLMKCMELYNTLVEAIKQPMLVTAPGQEGEQG